HVDAGVAGIRALECHHDIADGHVALGRVAARVEPDRGPMANAMDIAGQRPVVRELTALPADLVEEDIGNAVPGLVVPDICLNLAERARPERSGRITEDSDPGLLSLPDHRLEMRFRCGASAHPGYIQDHDLRRGLAVRRLSPDFGPVEKGRNECVLAT